MIDAANIIRILFPGGLGIRWDAREPIGGQIVYQRCNMSPEDAKALSGSAYDLRIEGSFIVATREGSGKEQWLPIAQGTVIEVKVAGAKIEPVFRASLLPLTEEEEKVFSETGRLPNMKPMKPRK